MTSPLRRKRRTILRGPSTPARMAVSAFVLCLGLGSLRAQESISAPAPSEGSSAFIPPPAPERTFPVSQKAPDKNDKEEKVQENKQDKDKEAPTIMYPSKERYGR